MPVAVGIPVTAPVEESMSSPAGRPDALQVRVAPESVSVAEGVRVTSVPVGEARLTSVDTTTELLMVQVKAADPAWPVLSLAISPTE